MRELKLKYKKPAPDSDFGWENYSLPIGCGWFGVNVFGIVENERLQVTDPTVLTKENLTNAAEIRIRFPHEFDSVTNYERGLSLDNALAYVKYDLDGVHYEREYFASHPDRTLGIRLTSNKPESLNFNVDLQVPFICEFGDENGFGRTGETFASGNILATMSHLEYYNVYLSSQLRVLTNGTVTDDGKTLTVSNASEAVIYFSCETNYVMTPKTFSEEDPQKKIPVFDPTPNVTYRLERLEMCGLNGYSEVKAKHINDYRSLFGRVVLELEGGRDDLDDLPTEDLLGMYQGDNPSPFLETLYYQYGRYMLICSSRKGCLPATLQGIWNCHRESPWGSGYWHNINVQMNYWPVFSTNLAELFKAYSDFNEAFRSSEEKNAVEFAKKVGTYTDDNDSYGWAIGTSVRPYRGSFGPGGHSGPGTGGLTSKLFWDWWDFTRDESVLEKSVFPAIHSLSHAYTHAVKEYDGEYLSIFSASPENVSKQGDKWGFHVTVGCAFDQQMIWENGKQDLKCAELLGYTDDTIETIKNQIDHYHPVEIGRSGQIKEYREEVHYSDIGEPNHRHISQLIGLMPGTSISKNTPAWLDAAKHTLDLRTDQSTGWALAHRLNAWARTCDGNRAHKLLHNLIANRTFPNLWDAHPPFQIDGNFGGTSGMTEMLLQSHAGYIDILPSLPDEWKLGGSYTGLVARGNFCVDVKWKDSQVYAMSITSRAGQVAKVHYSKISGAKIVDANGNDVDFEVIASDMITFETEIGMRYDFIDIPATYKIPTPLNAEAVGYYPHISWKAACDEKVTYTIYKNTDSKTDYEVVAEKIRATEFIDFAHKNTDGGYTMYKIVAVPDDKKFSSSDGAVCVVEDK